MLGIVRDYGFPVALLTKNKLVLKDLDMLEEINGWAGATVCMTIVFSRGNERLREIFEPGASTIAERFEALKILHGRGIRTGIWMLPILPWLGDGDENLEAIVNDAASAGVDFILPGGLTLKPGRSKREFMACLESFFPELVAKYAAFYGNDDKYGAPDIKLARGLGARDWRPALRRYCINSDIALETW
jgi:DNA repair photolyase